MLIYTKGDMFESEADILVCPVNCVGTMGKGLALQFKERFPELDAKYQAVLRSGDLYINHPCVVRANGQRVCLFPTKWHWREPSRIEWVVRGMNQFWWGYVSDADMDLTVAMPKLGCGLGGLTWGDVKAVLDQYDVFYGARIYIYE
jgi:O-acetyl-ADP-ribose deacetylase (regulator of RNase III)